MEGLESHHAQESDQEAHRPRLLAQYANIAATILDAKVSAMFRPTITRTVGGKAEGEHPLEQWWQDVDGWGCNITDWMSDGFIAAGVYGHVFHVLDRENLAPIARPTPPPTRRVRTSERICRSMCRTGGRTAAGGFWKWRCSNGPTSGSR
jgi:hypothetical protein